MNDVMEVADHVAALYLGRVAAVVDAKESSTTQIVELITAGRSGDIMILFKPYWIESLNTTTHGSGYQYDTHVPVIFMGAGIAKGEYLMRVSPTDVAPTLAFLAGVTLPLTSGRVLSEAIAPIVPHQ